MATHNSDLQNYLSTVKGIKNEIEKSLFQYHLDKLPNNLDNLKKKLEDLCCSETVEAKKNYYMHVLKIVLAHQDKVKNIVENVENIKNDLTTLHSELN